MNPNPRRARGEDGVSLVLAIAFLALLGVLTASLLTVTYASFKTTESVRAGGARLYSADGGMEYAVQTLRTSTSYCANSAAGSQTLPAQTINGKTVSVTCQTLSGSTGGGGGSGWTSYALVVTGYPGPTGSNPTLSSAIKTSGQGSSNEAVYISGGPAFNAGGFSLVPAAKLTFTHDLHEYDAPTTYCTNAKAAAASSDNPHVNGTWTCEPASFAVPDPLPSLKVPSAAAPASSTSGSCTTLFPGKYTSAPTFLSSNKYYLASGVYYFEGTGNITLKGQIFGGQPQAPETQVFTGISPCSNDAAANALVPGSASGYGVELVLGGSSKLTINNSSSEKMEFFSRVPGNPAVEGTPGVSLFAPRTAGTGYQAWNSDFALVMGGTSGQVVFHGGVYEPNSSLKAWALPNNSAGNASAFSGGLVVQVLEIAIGGSFVGGTTSAGLPSGAAATPRTVVITATSTATGEAPVTETAVVTFGTGSTTPPTVGSWRKN